MDRLELRRDDETDLAPLPPAPRRRAALRRTVRTGRTLRSRTLSPAGRLTMTLETTVTLAPGLSREYLLHHRLCPKAIDTEGALVVAATADALLKIGPKIAAYVRMTGSPASTR